MPAATGASQGVDDVTDVRAGSRPVSLLTPSPGLSNPAGSLEASSDVQHYEVIVAWKTPGGHVLNEGDRVVWLHAGAPDWKITGIVVEVTLENDETDGEVWIKWDDNVVPPNMTRQTHWFYPFWVEIIDKVNIADRLAQAI